MSARQRIDPIRPRLLWRVLSDADIERLDAAIIEVLGDVSVRFQLSRALNALERGGRRVDRAAQVARMPEHVVPAALVAAEAGVPVGFLSLTLGCASAPATMAGNLVVNVAAVIAGTVLLELAYPGAPGFLVGAPSVMDLKTGGYTGGSREDYVLAAAATQMAHNYGLAINMGTMASGAKEPGWQAAVDDALSTLASVSAGAEMMSGCGLLDGSKTLSHAHLLMEAEVYSIVQKVAGGIVVDDETLALDVIKMVGPGGPYVAEKLTRAHMKDIWRPGVWDRAPYETWLRDGRRGALQNAEVLARDILATHAPAPLPDDVRAELRRLVEVAEGELR